MRKIGCGDGVIAVGETRITTGVWNAKDRVWRCKDVVEWAQQRRGCRRYHRLPPDIAFQEVLLILFVKEVAWFQGGEQHHSQPVIP